MLKKVGLILSLVCASTSHGITPVPHTSANTRKKEITHAGKKNGAKKKISASKDGLPTGVSAADQLAAAQQTLSTLTPGTDAYNQQQNLVNAMLQAQATGPAITPEQLAAQQQALNAAHLDPSLAGTSQALNALSNAGVSTAGFVVAGSQAALQQVAASTFTPAQLATLQAAGIPATSGGTLSAAQQAALTAAHLPTAGSTSLGTGLTTTFGDGTGITATFGTSTNNLTNESSTTSLAGNSGPQTISAFLSQYSATSSSDSLSQSTSVLPQGTTSQQAVAQVAQAAVSSGFLQPSDPPPLQTNIATQAFSAAITGADALTQFLTSNPRAINQPLDTGGRDLLQIISAGKNSSPLVTVTLQAGANINSLASTNPSGTLVWNSPVPADPKTQALIRNTLQLQQTVMDQSATVVEILSLLSAGAVIQATTSAGDTSLTLALGQNNSNPSIISLLATTLGININAQNDSGQTALYLAANTQAPLQVVQTLVANSADESINAKDSNGDTALSLAVANDDPAVTTFLLNAGANVFLSSNTTAPTKDLFRKKSSITRDGNPTVQDIIANTKALITGLAKPLSTPFAAKDVQNLIDMGAAVNATDNNGNTALFFAAKKNNLGACCALLNAGANAFAVKTGDLPASQDPNSCYALIVSPSTGVQQFLNRWKSFVGNPITPPTLLPLRRSPTAIYIHGATDSDGATALHYMAQSGNGDWAKKFMDDGASSAAQDKKGTTPWHMWAMGWVDGNNDATYKKAAASLNPADADIPNYSGATPLMLAAGAGNLGAVTVLLANKNVDINATDLWGDTPLHWAAGNSNLATCAALIAQFKTLNFTLDTQNIVGKTAAHYAASLGAQDVYNALKKAGASTTIKDSFGKSPAILLKEYGSGK